jgi:hypothetical protein
MSRKRTAALAVAAGIGLWLAGGSAAQASDPWGLGFRIGGTSIGFGHYGGYHGYGGHHGYGHYDWHDTSHYDWHPGEFQRHRNHYHYVPGHYDFHSDGHWDYHRGHHGSHYGHRGGWGRGHHRGHW